MEESTSREPGALSTLLTACTTDVHGVADVGDGEGDLLGAPDLQRPGEGVGHVGQLERSLLDPLAHVVGRGEPVEHG